MKRKPKPKKPGTWDSVRVVKRKPKRKDNPQLVYFEIQFPKPTTFCVIKDFQ